MNKIVLLFFCMMTSMLWAQEVVVDSTDAIVTEKKVVKKDTVKGFKKYKAEGVSAVIGDYVILDSDIDKGYLELEQQGLSVEDVNRCQLLGKLMEDKLYAHHAKVDSLEVSDSEVNERLDQQLAYILQQFGGDEEKMVQYYKKESLAELRKELFSTNKNIMLANRMQQQVVEGVEVTPEEVRQFFFAIPEEERPVLSAEVEVAQIIIKPEITDVARQEVIDRLNQYRRDIVENGASFATKAVLYSKDGSAAKGGLIEGIRKTSPFAKEFKDVAFSLLEGEVSEPFETEFGFHIVTVDKVRGQEIDVRHIILFPEISDAILDEAKTKIDSIRSEIVGSTITFDEAAKKFSHDEETRNNGGLLVNPVSFDTRFDLTKMDPELGGQVYNLEENEVSQVLIERDRTGKVSYKIVSVVKRFEEHVADFQKDYEKIKDLALKEKQIREIGKWQDKKIKETYVNVNNDYQGCEFTSNWLKI